MISVTEFLAWAVGLVAVLVLAVPWISFVVEKYFRWCMDKQRGGDEESQ